MDQKLPSLILRNCPRDIYDIAYLSDYIAEESYSAVKEILFTKAINKDILISGIPDFVNPQKARSNKRAWQNSLGTHLPNEKLLDFDEVYLKTKHFIEKILNSQNKL